MYWRRRKENHTLLVFSCAFNLVSACIQYWWIASACRADLCFLLLLCLEHRPILASTLPFSVLTAYINWRCLSMPNFSCCSITTYKPLHPRYFSHFHSDRLFCSSAEPRRNHLTREGGIRKNSIFLGFSFLLYLSLLSMLIRFTARVYSSYLSRFSDANSSSSVRVWRL